MKRHICSWLAFLLMMACGNKQTVKNSDTKQVIERDTLNKSQIVSFSREHLKRVGVEIGTPTRAAVSGTLILQGAIDVPPQNTVNLSFPLGGYLQSTKMLPGMRIKKGEVLAILEDMQFIQMQQDYLTAKTDFTLAETEYIRQRDLNASKASSDKVFQQAKAEMERQRILMNALSQKLQVIGIDPNLLQASNISKSVALRSPINGFVSKVNVSMGKYVAPTDVLFELVDPSDIHLALHVFEKDLGQVHIGDKVTAYTNSDPDKKYEGEIILINQSLDANRMAQIHCHFKRYNPALVPGMFMNGEVALQHVEALVVPEEAVVRWQNNFYVFVQRDVGHFEMTAVEAGLVYQGKQQITAEAIDPQTSLVVKNAFALLMKLKNTETEE